MLYGFMLCIAIVVGFMFLESAYCTTPERERVFNIFHPAMFMVLLTMFVINGWFAYIFYLVNEQLVREQYSFKIYNMLSRGGYEIFFFPVLWLLLFARKNGGTLMFFHFIFFGISFMCCGFTFLFTIGGNIIGSTITFITEGTNLIDGAHQFVPKILSGDFTSNTGQDVYAVYKVGIMSYYLAVMTGAALLAKGFDESPNDAVATCVLIIAYCTGLYFILGILSYLISKPIWEVFD